MFARLRLLGLIGVFALLSGQVGAALGASPAFAAPPVVTIAPEPGTIVAVAPDGAMAVTVAGTGVEGTPIVATVVVDGDPVTLCSTTVAADGSWSCIITEAPDFPGPVTVYNDTDLVVLPFGVLHAPTIETDAGSSDTVTSTMTVESPVQAVRGTGVRGALLSLALNDGSGCTTTVDSGGTWECSLTALPTGAGPYTLIASQAFPTAPSQRAPSAPVTYGIDMAPIIVTPGPGSEPDPWVDPAPGTELDPGADPGSGPGTDPGPGSDPAPVPGPGLGEGGGTSPGTGAGDGGPASENGAGQPDSESSEATPTDPPTDHATPAITAGGPSSTGVDSTGAGDNRSAVPGGRNSGTPAQDASDRPHRGDPLPQTASEAGSATTDAALLDAARLGALETPSAFSLSLADFNQVLSRTPTQLAVLALALAGFILLVIVPGGLLESTLTENRARIQRSRPAQRLRTLTSILTRTARTLIAPRERGTTHRLMRAPQPPSQGSATSTTSLIATPGSDVSADHEFTGPPLPEASATPMSGPPAAASTRRGLRRRLAPATSESIRGRATWVAAGGAAVASGAEPAGARSRRARGRVGVVVGVMAVGAAASVWVAPSAVLDGQSLRLFAAFFVAAAVAGVVPALMASRYARRRLGASGRISARPAMLVLTVATVALSRFAGLEPGFVFGVVVGLALVVTLRRAASARLVVASTTAVLAAGAAAWVAQNLLRPSVLAHPDLIGSATLDVLTAVTVCSLSGPVVSLLPLRFLDGHRLFAVSKSAWATLYAVAALLFGLLLLPLPDAWSQVTSGLLLWGAAAATALAISLGVWAYFRYVPERTGVSAPDARSPEPAVHE